MLTEGTSDLLHCTALQCKCEDRQCKKAWLQCCRSPFKAMLGPSVEPAEGQGPFEASPEVPAAPAHEVVRCSISRSFVVTGSFIFPPRAFIDISSRDAARFTLQCYAGCGLANGSWRASWRPWKRNWRSLHEQAREAGLLKVPHVAQGLQRVQSEGGAASHCKGQFHVTEEVRTLYCLPQ